MPRAVEAKRDSRQHSSVGWTVYQQSLEVFRHFGQAFLVKAQFTALPGRFRSLYNNDQIYIAPNSPVSLGRR